MCTAISYRPGRHYFGRNLDLEFSYHETVTVTPRSFPFRFRRMGEKNNHYAMIGMAFVAEGYPLYYDAVNEKGLGMAGLNFPGNAVYQPEAEGKDNVAPFEFIPWVLSQCATVDEAEALLARVNLARLDFSAQLPASPLHWIIADRVRTIVVEPLADGLKVYDDPVGVLTNNPPFDYHLLNLANYMGVTREEPANLFSGYLELAPYSRGMGTTGLPGGLSSTARFVKATFTMLNSVCGADTESARISQFFHILGSVDQQKGCCRVGEKFEYTIYSSCCDTERGIYYYTTYENSQISGVDMNKEDLDGSALVSYPLIQGQQIRMQN